MKVILSFLLSINILIANQSNVVKTSELELFLFKIGFESLLKDVDITKSKSNLNETELKKLNSKIEIIMEELYKDKRVITNDSDNLRNIDESINKEILLLKDEVSFLKNQINKLLLIKKSKKSLLSPSKYKINVDTANIRLSPSSDAKVVEVLSKGTLVDIEYCNNYSWCKFNDEKKYIARFLINK